MHAAGQVFRSFQSALDERFVDDHLGRFRLELRWICVQQPAFVTRVLSTPLELDHGTQLRQISFRFFTRFTVLNL
jgi:hypothetical protein